MKLFKVSSILVLSFLMIWAFSPELSAKNHHHRHGHHHRHSNNSSRTFFGFSLNLAPAIPSYSQTTYITQPVPYERVTYVQPSTYYSSERVYYPTYREEVIVQRPVYQDRVYVQPQFSYWNY